MAKAKKEVPQVGHPDDKLKALEAARLQIEKQFGQGSLMKLGANNTIGSIESIPSGSILLDACSCRSTKTRRNCSLYRC